MTAERWQAFERYAAWVRGKPTWDDEERALRLAVAEQLRAGIEALAAGEGPTALLEAVSGPRYGRAELTPQRQTAWFRRWLESGGRGLGDALAGFTASRPPAERLAAFTDAATRTAEADDATALAFGSLLNFAMAPAELPFVLQPLFGKLEDLLGLAPSPGAAPAAEYGFHLEFAGRVRDRLRAAGLEVDILDAWALVLDAARNAPFWAGERGVAIDAPPARRETPHYLAVCAIYKDEASYLREWIEFHRLAGVERFFLYDNNSTDEHRELLAPYVARGEVVIHDWPMEQGQRPAYDDCIARHAADARWIAFIDLDEFLFSPTGRPLPELLPRYERWPAVGANWAVFGSSGHVSRPPGLVIESYLQRLGTPANRTIKSIVDPTRVVKCTGVHAFAYSELGTVDENEFPIRGGSTKSESRRLLRVNHYVTKSLEEYRARSARNRPNPYGPENPHAFRRPFDPELLAIHERLGERDEAILQYVPDLRAALGLQPA